MPTCEARAIFTTLLGWCVATSYHGFETQVVTLVRPCRSNGSLTPALTMTLIGFDNA